MEVLAFMDTDVVGARSYADEQFAFAGRDDPNDQSVAFHSPFFADRAIEEAEQALKVMKQATQIHKMAKKARTQNFAAATFPAAKTQMTRTVMQATTSAKMLSFCIK
jgi:hypothetical protein